MPYFLIVVVLFVNWLLITALLAYAWTRRALPSVRYFIGLGITLWLWSAGATIATISGTSENATFWFLNIRFLGIPFVPITIIAFALEYTGRGHLITRKNLVLLSVIPAITCLIVWIAPHLILDQVTFTRYGVFLIADTIQFRGWFWFHVAFSYVGVLSGLVLLAQHTLHARHLYRWQSATFTIGLAFLLMVNGVTIVFMNPMRIQHHDLTALLFSLTAGLWAFALFRFRLLETMPIARDAVLEHMDDAVFVLDIYNRLVDFNPAAAPFVSGGRAAIGQSYERAFTAFPHLIDLCGASSSAHAEIVLPVGGQQRSYDARVSNLLSRATAIGRMIVLRDVTEVRQAQAQAMQAQVEQERVRVLSRFVRDTSHEFRTPLSVIRINAYMMAREPREEGRIERQAGIDHQVERMSSLIDQLLLMVRLDTDPTLEREPLDLHDVLDGTVRKLQYRFADKSIRVDYALTQPIPPIRADHDLICQALYAVLQNSFQHTPPQGEIRVATARANGHIEITLQDSGAGMSAHDLERVFERFFRADEAHSTAGFGLGLPIARRILELHAGQLDVRSTPGSGTTVRLTLPVG